MILRRGIHWSIIAVFVLIVSIYTMIECDREPTILILGAGMAGISAAKALVDRDFTNINIIEGSSRIGGRIKSEKMGKHSVELGAMWIYGKGTNPVYKMAAESGLSFIDSEEFHPNSWSVKDEHGKDISTDADKMFKLFDDIVKVLVSDTYDKGDVTVREMLQKLGWNPEKIWENVIEDYFIGFESGISAENLSAKYLLINAPYDEFQSDALIPVNDSEGYQSLFDHMISSIPTDLQIHFNNHVTHINQSKDSVAVQTRDGSVYRADYAVVTFSLGVLQHNQVTFTPPLPTWKRSAINKFGMCLFGHIYLQFPTSFWDDTPLLVFLSEERRQTRFWYNMNHIHPGSNILQLTTFGEESKRIERLNDNEVISELVKVLQRMYPDKHVPFPVDYTISRWQADPLFRGAFSYWPADFTAENMEELIAPVGRVYFAGEHLSHKQYGFVHSAHVSGAQVANEILDLMATTDAFSLIN